MTINLYDPEIYFLIIFKFFKKLKVKITNLLYKVKKIII